jgi:hypothetical protein
MGGGTDARPPRATWPAARRPGRHPDASDLGSGDAVHHRGEPVLGVRPTTWRRSRSRRRIPQTRLIAGAAMAFSSVFVVLNSLRASAPA